MRIKDEDGQAVVLAVLAMGIFLFGAVGLGFDGSHLYSQRQMAQMAADAAAQAAMMSIFDGTNSVSANPAKFTASYGGSFSCSGNTSTTPCVYAGKNGFNTANGDSITVNFPLDSTVSGVALSPLATDPVNLVQVVVSRNVPTTLMRLLGTNATTVTAVATAAIVDVESPTPIVVTDPWNAGTLDANGNSTIKICGGASKAIQVNSSNAAALGNGVTLDLTHAGPADPGDCSSSSAGADFGVVGGPTTNPGNVKLGSTGSYVSPSSPVQDPYASVTPPNNPGGANPGTTNITTAGQDGCVTTPCTEFSPGQYTGGINIQNMNVIFKPGIYYLNGGGLTMKKVTGGGANDSAMCVCASADTNTGTGLLFYDTGPANAQGFAQTGGFNFTTLNNISFVGPTLTTTNTQGKTVPASPYYNIAMWEDRTAVAHTGAQAHALGQGNGCFQVTGSIYITNTLALMQADATHKQVQAVSYGGNPCSTTVTQGDIIAGQLHLNGNTASITMNLTPFGFTQVRQVALVQ